MKENSTRNNQIKPVTSIKRKSISKPPAADTAEFLQAVSDQRNSFCLFINSTKWNTALRTECENLLIMYDQMINRLK